MRGLRIRQDHEECGAVWPASQCGGSPFGCRGGAVGSGKHRAFWEFAYARFKETGLRFTLDAGFPGFMRTMSKCFQDEEIEPVSVSYMVDIVKRDS